MDMLDAAGEALSGAFAGFWEWAGGAASNITAATLIVPLTIAVVWIVMVVLQKSSRAMVTVAGAAFLASCFWALWVWAQ